MSHTRTQTHDLPLLGTPPGDLLLRVGGGGLDDQSVRISAGKCTIGSSRQCTLRLRRAGVRPVHCVILRGAIGTVVRRWSPQTRLNGMAFTDAPLRVGDRLCCGPVELRVLDERAEQEASSGNRQADALKASAGSLPSATGRCAAPSGQAMVDKLRSALGQSRQRTRRIVEQLRYVRVRSNQLDALLHCERERSDLAAAAAGKQAETNAAQRDAMATRNAQLREALGEAESARRKTAQELAAEKKELEELAARSSEQEKEIERLRGQLRPCPESPLRPDQQPPAVGDAAVVAADDKPTPEPAATSRETPSESTDSGQNESAEPNESESFNDYLSRLFRGVRGEPAPGAVAASQPFTLATGAPAAERTESQPSTGSDEVNPLVRCAVDRHAQKQWLLKGIDKLLVAIGAILAAAAILIMLQLQAWHNGDLDVMVGMVALLIAVVWGLQGAVILRLVHKARTIGHPPRASRHREDREDRDVHE